MIRSTIWKDMPRAKLTQEQAERLVEVLVGKGRGTWNECWIYVDRRYEIVAEAA
jgi:hypothetical protein